MARDVQDDLQRKLELNWLSAFYGGMLTAKQREVVRLHCEEDLSLGEIAEEAGISRQAVHDLLSRASRQLLELEARLGAAGRFSRMQEGLAECEKALKEKRYHDAQTILASLCALEREDDNGL